MLGCIQPMSSPIMKRMLSFCCCAAAGSLASSAAANIAEIPSSPVLSKRMIVLPVFQCVSLHTRCIFRMLAWAAARHDTGLVFPALPALALDKSGVVRGARRLAPFGNCGEGAFGATGAKKAEGPPRQRL